MFKKVLTIFLLLWGIQIMVIACCPDSKRFFNRITGVQANNYNIQNGQIEDEIIAQEDYRIRLVISEETYTDNSFNPYFLVNAAYALDCEDIFEGLEPDIVNFSITCDKTILNTNAGQPIDYENLNVYKIGLRNEASNRQRTVEEWLDIMNNGGFLLGFEWLFEFNQPINSEEELTFNIKIVQEDNTQFEIETNPIRIEQGTTALQGP